MTQRCLLPPLLLLMGLLHSFPSSAHAMRHRRQKRTSHSRAAPSLITREHVGRRLDASRNLVSRGTPTGGGKYPFLAVVDWTDFDNGHGVRDPRVRGVAKLDGCRSGYLLTSSCILPRIDSNLRIFGATA
jgi:hypothetical protein